MEKQLHLAEIRIEWDFLNKKEVEDSKKIYQQARREGRLITNLTGEEITFFHPNMLGFLIKEKELTENQSSFRIFDETGDRRIIWDSKNPLETQDAENLFAEYIKKGWRAYAISSDLKVRKRLLMFNPTTEEILFEEKTLRETLSSFVSKFKEIKMLPKTIPG